MGDSGLDGIQDFFDQHDCNAICGKLTLAPIRDIRASLKRRLAEQTSGGEVDDDDGEGEDD